MCIRDSAWTQLTAPKAMNLTVQIEHNDGCKIWLNGAEVYAWRGDREINLRRDERSLKMSHDFEIHLQKGPNTLLLKSETRGGEWRVYLQPPSEKGAVVNGAVHPEIGLRGVKDVDAKIAELTNWLVVGPFANARRDLDAVQAPETEFRFGRMYPGLAGPVTWMIPKIEIHGATIDPQPWGTNYDWNYHNGGVAWAMQHLATATGESRYAEWAKRFCDFHLAGIPFVEHQVKTLNAAESANHFIIETPLLDFTLAPSLPFVHRLRTEKEFAGRAAYEKWVGRMLDYARCEQIRLPGHGIFTRTTPVEFTTWVDDMFMGIPFLVQAALLAQAPETRQQFFDDAAHQVLEFKTQVWDEEEELYVHAREFGDHAKLPHWSRCNGWAIWAMSEVLLHLPAAHPQRAAILEQFRRHATSLTRWQDASGFWFNVLERPDSRPEVSGTAIFVLAMARGVLNGWLDTADFLPVATRAWTAITSAIEADGTVHGICMGTMCTADEEYYVNRPFYDNDTHGLFAVLFAGIEFQKLRQLTRQRDRRPRAANPLLVQRG